jgi:hypothetical protein
MPAGFGDEATVAFTSFFAGPEAADLQVALRMWPDPDGCDGRSRWARCRIPPTGTP